jgi:DinB superfamily
VATISVCADLQGGPEGLCSRTGGREGSMTRESRSQRIKEFGSAPAELMATLRQIPKRMWLFKPAPDRWSIHEIVLHLCDSEVDCYMTCRRLIAEPGTEILEYDASRWTDSLGYLHQSTKEALEIKRRLRRMTHWLLATAREEVWSHTVKHPQRGELSLEQWLEQEQRHFKRHIKQIHKNYEVWQATHPSRKPPSARSEKREPSSRRVYKCA